MSAAAKGIETVAVGQEGAGRIRELDGLRALAILPVVLHHCYPPGGALALVGERGWAGVDLFFVLSGYLIIGILLGSRHQPNYYRNFIARRTLRIFPLYYFCLATFTAAVWLTPAQDARISFESWGGARWFVFYLGNLRAAWQNSLPPVFSFAPLWSLQVEEQFYLLYPLAVWLLSLEGLRRFLIGCVIAAPMLRTWIILSHPGNDTAPFVLMPCRMDSLALGGLVAVTMNLARPVRWKLLAAVSVPAAIGILAGRLGSAVILTLGLSVIGLACASVLGMVLAKRDTRFAAFLRLRPLVYIGQISYGLYLLHGPASWLARTVAGAVLSRPIAGHSWLSVPLTFAAGILGATISWRWFESPILTLASRFRSVPLSDRSHSTSLQSSGDLKVHPVR
jgi:peptidoglycan/LPS O-acetylase OafA/YrhL